MIRFDSLLVRALADALGTRLAGRTVRALRLDPSARRALFVFRDEALEFRLDPAAPSIRHAETPGGRIDSALPAGARVRSVTAPPDERILLWSFDDDDAPDVLVELMTNRPNLLVVGPDHRIRAVLAPRDGQRRTLRPGAPYTLPAPTGRAGAQGPLSRDAFVALLEPVAPADRARALIRHVAYTSPLNATAILGAAAQRADADALAEAWARYQAVVAQPERAPCMLTIDGAAQPYPVPLPDTPHTRHADLIDAFDAATQDTAELDVAAAIDRLRERVARHRVRVARMRDEAAGAAAEADALRRSADLLLAQPHAVRKGATRAVLDDFAGGTLEVDLDPALSPTANAERWYDAARKRERAAQRLPPMIRNAEREAARLAHLLERAERGELDARDLVPTQEQAVRKGKPGPTLPYRRYRTSGGLEVRVGRGSSRNDDLTFRHSRPDDVWMHARDVAGAHVILRWDDRNANPPAADLREAAVLAALHSRARTSGLVAVDWTRRKYVRKPRKAPPGRVTVERTRTLFVEPNPTLEERLRETD